MRVNNLKLNFDKMKVLLQGEGLTQQIGYLLFWMELHSPKEAGS